VQKLDYNKDWGEYFKLDVLSQSGLVRIRNKVGKDIEGYVVGYRKFDENGEKDSWRLQFKDKTYQIHRIIWVLTYGSISPDLVIDHLDGDPFNNKIGNLQLKTPADNLRNQRLRKTNTTGVTGVSRVTTNKNPQQYYVATWVDLDGKAKSKYFSILKLGESEARALATTYREQQILRLTIEGANYTERHGN